jgi:hypothetical protein
MVSLNAAKPLRHHPRPSCRYYALQAHSKLEKERERNMEAELSRTNNALG